MADTYVALPLWCPCSVADGDKLCLSSGPSPFGLGAEIAVDDGLFNLVGRDVLRAFRYNPQALQIVDPRGERRQSGVWLVPQLLFLHVNVMPQLCALPDPPERPSPAPYLHTWPKGGGTVMGA